MIEWTKRQISILPLSGHYYPSCVPQKCLHLFDGVFAELLKNSAKNHLDDNILGKPRMCGKHSANWFITRSVVEEGPKSCSGTKTSSSGQVYPSDSYFKAETIAMGHPSPLFRTLRISSTSAEFCVFCFMQPACLVACCLRAQLVTKSLKWQKRRRLKEFVHQFLTHPEPLSLLSILPETASYPPHLFQLQSCPKRIWAHREAWVAAACFLSPDCPLHHDHHTQCCCEEWRHCEDIEGKSTTVKLDVQWFNFSF